jgi:hypothetical protein
MHWLIPGGNDSDQHSFTPPSGLPVISPARGEISGFNVALSI